MTPQNVNVRIELMNIFLSMICIPLLLSSFTVAAETYHVKTDGLIVGDIIPIGFTDKKEFIFLKCRQTTSNAFSVIKINLISDKQIDGFNLSGSCGASITINTKADFEKFSSYTTGIKLPKVLKERFQIDGQAYFVTPAKINTEHKLMHPLINKKGRAALVLHKINYGYKVISNDTIQAVAGVFKSPFENRIVVLAWRTNKDVEIIGAHLGVDFSKRYLDNYDYIFANAPLYLKNTKQRDINYRA
jgi:hypothetical protein